MDKVRDTLRDAKWLSSGKRVRVFALAIVAALSLMTVRCEPTPTPSSLSPGIAGEQHIFQVIVEKEVAGEIEDITQVIVRVPSQPVEVEVLKLATGKLEELRSEDDELEAERLVINFEVIDRDTQEMLSSFDPPIELEVAYTAQDVQNANGLDNLVLGFWHETEEKWIAFDDKHEFRLEGDSQGGIGFATISSWGDRRIAYGH